VGLLFLLLFNSLSWAQSSEISIDDEFRQIETGSDTFGSFSLGHNLTSNGRTLKSGQTSLGSLYVAHGITDNITVGTSPFVVSNFEMFNLMLRAGFDLSARDRISFDASYFKTFGGEEIPQEPTCYLFIEPGSTEEDWSEDDIECFPSDPFFTGFIMEAMSLKTTYSRQMLRSYRMSTTLSYFFYWDERNPFSFRMDPANGDEFALNLSTLHEFRITDLFYINYELGLWGLNYQYPYTHTGLTLNLQAQEWLFGFGASVTRSFSFPDQYERNFLAGYTSRMSIHPEFEFQFFF
jgi:hypothetical protein